MQNTPKYYFLFKRGNIFLEGGGGGAFSPFLKGEWVPYSPKYWAKKIPDEGHKEYVMSETSGK